MRMVSLYRKLKCLLKINKLKSDLRNFARFTRSKGVRVYCIDLPRKDRINNLSDFERERIANWVFDFNNIHKEQDRIGLIYQGLSLDYVESLFQGVVVFNNGTRKALKDFYSKHVNIIGGQRRTTDQPTRYSHTIYTLGACTIRGTGVEDSGTVASYLQRSINSKYKDSYRVVNLGIGFGSDYHDDIQAFSEQDIKGGDIIIWGIYGMVSNLGEKFLGSLGFKYVDTTKAVEERNTDEAWFTDNTLHTTAVGNKIIANVAFKCLEEDGCLKQCIGENENKSLLNGNAIDTESVEFKKYLDYIRELKREKTRGINGCIVMNCNPFTYGHQYLIEYASKQVETLYIFVVEENKSFFQFEDRKKMVELGTAHLNNVVVLGSGQFIISAVTFPGYFLKDHIKESTIDCSNDLSIFALHIAPLLEIKVRFAGEEPLDPITNQYNQAMAQILPQYGIEFRTIKRLEKNNGVISASRVRRCMEGHQLDDIKDLVPASTYDYLLEHYKI